MPAGVINLVTSDQDDIYKWISAESKINCISFDGRLNIAQDLIVSQSCMHPEKKILFNLEGKSSMVIYDSADFDSACESVVDGFLYSNGQVKYFFYKTFIVPYLKKEVIFFLIKFNLGSNFNLF